MKTVKWIYENDSKADVRYVLGIEGEHPLICFGINPSTAKPNELDNTLKSVDRLARSNGYDSWIMLNIYPQRATNPKDIHQSIDKHLHKKNIDFITGILSTRKADIWAAWGTLIEKRPFLIPCLFDIYTLTNKFKCQWVSIGKESKHGHPHHPLYLHSMEKIKAFPIEQYINAISYNINQVDNKI
jgi:hypothetical protein